MKKIDRTDLATIIIVAICIGALVHLVRAYVAIQPEPKDHCRYEIKYLHVSGREITKRVTGTCQGFYHWHIDPQRYNVSTVVLPFSDGSRVLIQGATDILSVAKISTE